MYGGDFYGCFSQMQWCQKDKGGTAGFMLADGIGFVSGMQIKANHCFCRRYTGTVHGNGGYQSKR